MQVLGRLTDGLWRVRESCCAALAELLSVGAQDPLLDRLAEMWGTLFRVRDDIKESVRLAANRTLEVLSRVSRRRSLWFSVGRVATEVWVVPAESESPN